MQNIGHFDDEIDMVGLTGLGGMQVDIIKPHAGPFGFFGGHGEIVLASGRQHNWGCATDHPSFSTSSSFMNQVLPRLDMLRHWKKSITYNNDVHSVKDSIAVDATKWTRMAQLSKGVSECTTRWKVVAKGALLFPAINAKDCLTKAKFGTSATHLHRMSDSSVFATVSTGFLGSGKTTPLNHILAESLHSFRFAIIENEFDDVGVDEFIAGKKQSTNEDVIEMNGCICCTVRGDLVQALKRLHKQVRSFDAVLIETTGMADPAPVAQTFFVDDDVKKTVPS